jgi:hypothetical protein
LRINLDIQVVQLGDTEEDHAAFGEMGRVVGDEGRDRAEGAGAVDNVN